MAGLLHPGRAASFLDHHLKCGNSLIGTSIEEVGAALNMAAERERLEVPLLAGLMGSQFAGVMLATDLMSQVGELSDVTAEQVRESHAQFRQASDALAPYKRILDIYTSRWFGNPDTKLTSPVLDLLRNPKTETWLKRLDHHQSEFKPEYQELINKAFLAAREVRFFHWELEYPEVFFGPSKESAQKIVLKDNPGFDAVVGNPPYDELSEDALGHEIVERNYLDENPRYRFAKEFRWSSELVSFLYAARRRGSKSIWFPGIYCTYVLDR